jgi:hypothetical protein
MAKKERFPLTYKKACEAKYLYEVQKWPMTKVALALKLNVGSVSRAVHGIRHPDAVPVAPDDIA